MTDSLFPKIDEPKIVEAIRQEELRSRGEIRIHITGAPTEDVLRDATAAFEGLGMTRTAERNGVLIFVASKSRTFAVLGDSGLTSVAGAGVLDEIAASMESAFRQGRFTEGLVGAVSRAGALLALHFPRLAGVSDQDELPNEISRG